MGLGPYWQPSIVLLFILYLLVSLVWRINFFFFFFLNHYQMPDIFVAISVDLCATVLMLDSDADSEISALFHLLVHWSSPHVK